MKRDEVLELFPDATKEQVDAILNKIGDELNPLKSDLKKANTTLENNKSELARLEKLESELLASKEQNNELKAKVQAGMTAEERLAELEKAAEESKIQFLLKSNELDARSIFLDAGFSDEQCASLLEQVVSTDTEKTKALAEAIVSTAKAQAEAVEQKTKDELLEKNPKLGGASASNTSLTKQEFDKLPYGEQVALIEENPDLLSSFANKPVRM